MTQKIHVKFQMNLVVMALVNNFLEVLQNFGSPCRLIHQIITFDDAFYVMECVQHILMKGGSIVIYAERNFSIFRHALRTYESCLVLIFGEYLKLYITS